MRRAALLLLSLETALTRAEASWQDLSAPWPDWTPCNSTQKFWETCDPMPATCSFTHPDRQFSSHGLGNALLVSYSRKAAAIFAERGCAPVFDEHPQDKVKTFGSLDDGSMFALQHHVEVAPLVPRVLTSPCTLFAITQPKPRAREAMRRARPQGEETCAAPRPRVAVYVRTGWADAAAAWHAVDCGGFEHLNQTGRVFGRDERFGMTLEEVADAAAAAGDGAFGAGAWELFVASDAPGVKRFVAERLRARSADVLLVEGEIGHNNPKASNFRTADANRESATNAVADLLLLAESDLVIAWSSKFPRAAEGRGGLCPRRQLDTKGKPRHQLQRLGALVPRDVARFEEELKRDDKELIAKLAAIVPEGAENPCLKDQPEWPLKACVCHYALSYKS